MRKLFAALALTVLVACGGDGATGVVPGDIPPEIPGTYSLSTINGVALPFLLQASGPKVEVISDSYTLTTAGSFQQSTSFRVTSGDSASVETFPDGGNYAVQNGTVIFTFGDGTTLSANVSGGILTFDAGGLATVYVKQ
jgi:hypothetical protein